MKQQRKVLDYCYLHLLILFFSFAGVMAKLASGYEFFSLEFIIFYGLELMILALFAVGWQQIIKKYPISIAYANRSILLVWALIFASLLFDESITANNILGALIVMVGVVLVGSDLEH